MRALLVALVAAHINAQCPSPYEGTSTDACFLISDFPATFSQCQQHCESNGGSLATIKSKAEDDYVRSLVTTQRAVWIGLFESGEQDESGVWEWVNGMSDTWRNWQPGEPNEWCTDEDCGLLAPGLWDGWVDASCTVRKIKSRAPNSLVDLRTGRVRSRTGRTVCVGGASSRARTTGGTAFASTRTRTTTTTARRRRRRTPMKMKIRPATLGIVEKMG